MLNHKIASNLLKHIFSSSGYVKDNTLDFYYNYPFLEGMNGDRYLALFTEMPVATGVGGSYKIKPGKEPWGLKKDPLSNEPLVPATPIGPNEASTSGYRRSLISFPEHQGMDKLTYTTFSGEGGTGANSKQNIKYTSGISNIGITGNLLFSNPSVSDGSDKNTEYQTSLKFSDGTTYIYNGDMILFPESTQDWGKIVGFGIFNDSGLTEQSNTLKNHNEQYYTDHLLFWGTLTPQDDQDEIGVEVLKNEIAIFRNNDFQISINNEELNKANPNA